MRRNSKTPCFLLISPYTLLPRRQAYHNGKVCDAYFDDCDGAAIRSTFNLKYSTYLKKLKIPHTMLITVGAKHSAKEIYEKDGIDLMKFHQKNFEKE